MAIRRVAIIFDSVQRPETTGVYCHRALSRLVEVQHFQPHELDQVPRAGIDLYINIDDGLRYRLPTDLRPCAWWAIDTHLDFSRCLEKSQNFDLVFAARTAMGPKTCAGRGSRPLTGFPWRATRRFTPGTRLPNNTTSRSWATCSLALASTCWS